MTVLALGIFGLTWALIASRRLALLPIGRPAGALLGAVLMVGTRVLTPEESARAVDGDTLGLLLGMMLVTAYLEGAGFFGWLAARLLRAARTPWALLAATSLSAAGLSALLVNDTVCLFLTPVVVAAATRAGLPLGPYLIALATSANLGSAATLVGNPQNMLIGSQSGMAFAAFSVRAAPAALVGVGVNLALLRRYYGRRLPAVFPSPPGPTDAAPDGPAVDPRALRLLALTGLGMLAGFLLGANLAFTALAGATFLIVARREDPAHAFARVDWPLLVFFAALFVVVAGLVKTGLPDALWAALAPRLELDAPGGLALFTTGMALASNVVSNVPLVLIVGPQLAEAGAGSHGWVLLGFVTTVAGNLTLVGSVANIIVAERAREHYALGFREYLRFGAVSTLAVLAAGVPVLWAVHALLS